MINNHIDSINKYLYCSILFSGLIFKREYIANYDASRFRNLNYFQVYLFAKVFNDYGGRYINIPLIECFADGENAFGISDSSMKNPLLANRKSIFSNLEYHKGLIKAIKIFDQENGSKLIEKFSKEYTVRSYTGMAKAAQTSKNNLVKYWKMMNELDINIGWIANIYFILLFIFGTKVTAFLVLLPKFILSNLRKFIH